MSDFGINFLNHDPSAPQKLEEMFVDALANTFVAHDKRKKCVSLTETSIRSFAALHDLPLDETRLHHIFN